MERQVADELRKEMVTKRWKYRDG